MQSKCNRVKFLAGLMLVVTTGFLSGTASAEYLGFPNGRTADFSHMPKLSVEGGFATGDFIDIDYQNIGLRVNYRLSPGLMVVGDLGMSEIGLVDATALGINVFYSLEGLFENMNSAVKGGFHKADFDVLDIDGLSLEFLISGLSPISSSGLNWYANVGLHRLEIDGVDDSEFGIGGGLVLPASTGEAYVGIDMIDDIVFGLGYRYFFQ